jgi:hypothetical protein
VFFSVQCLFVVQKWNSLIDLVEKFLTIAYENSSSTASKGEDLHFKTNLYLFIIHAQDILIRKNNREMESIKQAMHEDYLMFTQSQAASKKRSRRALLTGEIPEEEVEYLRRKAEFEEQLKKHERYGTNLQVHKKENEEHIEEIKRSTNNCKKSLRQCREIMNAKFNPEADDMINEGIGDDKPFREKSKSKAILSSMLINSYKKCIELLRKRQERYMLIQSLHEIGNIFYCDNQLKETEIHWNECIDFIFSCVGATTSFAAISSQVTEIAYQFGAQQ